MSQKLTADLAEKVIKADLKNLIDKVGAGRPLSSVEREIFSARNVEDGDVVHRRQLALMGKWADGSRLNRGELKEISDLLPDGVREDFEEIILEGERELKVGGKLRRSGYLLPYGDYAKLFAASARTVKRWAALGKEKGDFCPLDDAEALRIWWTRNMTQRCPARLLAAAVTASQAAGRKNAGAAEPIDCSSSGEKNGDGSLPPREYLPVDDDEVGLEATLSRLREAEVQANRLMVEALKAGDEGKATLAQTMWTKLTTQVRQVEKDARIDAEARGLLIPKNYAEARLVELHSGIERGVRGLYRRMCEVMRAPIDAETEEGWNLECDRLFSRLGAGGFLK